MGTKAPAITAQKAYDWRTPSRSPNRGRKVQRAWDAMLASAQSVKAFSAADIAAAAGANVRFVRSYVAVLRDAGYLIELAKFESSHRPARYRVGTFYRGETAPQIAGGSGGGKKLGNGWNEAPAAARTTSTSTSKTPRQTARKVRKKSRPPAKRLAASKRRRAAVAKKQRGKK